MILRSLILEFGYIWEEIPKYLEGRTPNGAKNRFFTYIVKELSPEERCRLEQKNSYINMNGNHISDPSNGKLANNTMELDGEDELEKLYKKMQELQAIMAMTTDQIQDLENNIYEPKNDYEN